MSPAQLPHDLKSRILRQTESQPSLTRPKERLRAALLAGSSLALALGVFYVRGGVRVTGRPTALIVGTSLGTAVIAAAGAWVALRRGRSMIGRSSLALSVMAVVTPMALLFWKIVWSARFPNGLDPWPGRVGFRCLNLSLLMGVAPLLALLFSRRRTDPTHPRLAGLSAGASVGLGVALFVDMWCPVGYVPHFFLGHLLPLALLALLGWLLGRAFLAPKK